VIAGAAGAIRNVIAERLEREGATTVGIDRQPHSVGTVSLQADLD
jgi:NADP-dependent 3-hydroxy acid dehydrogenase YdfG